ncbi:MAG TPA: carboxylating nicotinate-nucleotide diphosphorylase [Bryobacteraceae bacterium]
MNDVHQVVSRALEEDIGTGDVTTQACVPAFRLATGFFIARQNFVLAGTEVLALMYDGLHLSKHDGDIVHDGEIIAEVHGSARKLLERERTALNFLQRLSGVATLARAFADQVKGTACQVLDTRKTTPGLRLLEKHAAAAGGITNHRMGLFDAILIKNNHIAAAGGVKQALENARAASRLPIEIEVRTKAELDEALANGAPKLLLDNLTPEEAAAWIKEINGRATVEISGRVTLETVRAYAETGANYVSAGAITHSAKAVDISFRLELV